MEFSLIHADEDSSLSYVMWRLEQTPKSHDSTNICGTLLTFNYFRNRNRDLLRHGSKAQGNLLRTQNATINSLIVKVPGVDLDFCRSMFPEKACCVAGHVSRPLFPLPVQYRVRLSCLLQDARIKDMYMTLLGDNTNCQALSTEAKVLISTFHLVPKTLITCQQEALRQMYCLGCNPDQPKFTTYQNLTDRKSVV